MAEKLVNNHLLSSSWKKEKIFKKLYTGGKVEYDNTTKTIYTLCDGCILVISLDKGPFVIGSIGPYDSEKTVGTEHSEEILTFGLFSEGLNSKNVVTIGPKGIFRLWKISFKIEKNEENNKNSIGSIDFTYIRSWKSSQLTTNEIEFDSTGQYVATGGTDGSIQIYDAFGGFTTHVFKLHKSLITKLKFHGKRWLLFSSCVEGIIGVHDLTTGKLVVKLDSHYSVIHSFDLFETGLHSLGGLLTTGADNMISIWDLDKLPGSDKIGLLSNMKIEDEDNTLKKNKKRKGDNGKNNSDNSVNFLPIKQIHSTETIFSVKCTNSNLYDFGDEEENKCPWFIIAGKEKSGINIWNPINNKVIKSITPKEYSLNESAILYMFLDRKKNNENMSDFCLESFLILITEDRNIVILEYPTFKLYTIMFGDIPDYIQLSLFLRSNENRMYENKVEDEFLALKKEEDDYLTNNPSKIINCIVMDSTETPKLLSINNSPHYISSFIGHKSTVLTMDISNCCKYLATGGKDMTIKIWSIENNECLATLVGHTSIITALSFQKKPFVPGNNGYFLFSASNDNTLKGWNIASLFKKNKSKSKNDILAIYNIVAHKKEINHINISHNDKIIATSSEDKTLKLLSFPELRQIGTCKGHLSGIWQSSFSPIEKVIATASSDGSIKIWNINTFTCIKTLQGHDGSVLQVDFLGNGIQILSCGLDGLVKLWNTNTGECIKTFSAHEEKIWTLNVLKEYESDCNESSSRGNSKLAKTRYMVTGGSDSQLIFWRDNTLEVENEENVKNLKKIEDINRIDLLFNRKDYIDALNISLNQKLLHKTYLILEKLLKKGGNFEDSDSRSNILIYDNSDIKKNALDSVNYSNLCAWIKSLSKSELVTLFEFILEWITISKSVWLSNSLMYLVLTNIDYNELYKVEGFPQIIKIFRSYNTKVQSHLSSLNQKAYILDYLFLSSQISKKSSDQINNKIDAIDLTLDTLFKDN
ncbi:hypothetical protein FG386_001377 [Cryptosporidium ryanae]|uniref:uncharacterized protein n=1 Tax=Cryptosporidium ryanae TaxID=515981 RepID=UPI00351A15BF|nr:hypothetical protein FG386_001377 [Cryptosporidium ryanae]